MKLKQHHDSLGEHTHPKFLLHQKRAVFQESNPFLKRWVGARLYSVIGVGGAQKGKKRQF